jgi:hypothetical protein
MCLELAKGLDPDIARTVVGLGYDLDPGRGISRVVLTAASGDAAAPFPASSPEDLAAALASLDQTGLDDELIQTALERSVDSARYWQEPDGEDVLAAFPIVRDALAPLAERALALPGMQRSSQPRGTEQWAIEWHPAHEPVPLAKDPRQTLSEWGRGTRAEEARAVLERPDDPHANVSGTWWSIPLGLVRTTGQVPAGLGLVEDSLGWEDATAIPVRGDGRTLEIRTPDDWTTLCRTFPLDVTASRRHDWFRATGRKGRWVIPDWERVAGEWDAAHLTLLGYLSSATRALKVDADTASVIAGWDPDVTIWLTDVAREGSGPRQSWHRTRHDSTWSPVK